jgi:hypothetical protein
MLRQAQQAALVIRQAQRLTDIELFEVLKYLVHDKIFNTLNIS